MNQRQKAVANNQTSYHQYGVPIYELRIQLENIEPLIWRRVLVSGNINLGQLHDVIQAAMPWTNSHLHEFIIGPYSYSDPDFEMEESKNEFRYRLRRVAPRTSNFLAYRYDFGDGWEHQIRVERIIEGDTRYPGHPVCLEGARACPPDDCGGILGYQSFLQAIMDPTHEEHKEMLAWIGGSFDPEYFDLEEVNQSLRRIK